MLREIAFTCETEKLPMHINSQLSYTPELKLIQQVLVCSLNKFCIPYASQKGNWKLVQVVNQVLDRRVTFLCCQ